MNAARLAVFAAIVAVSCAPPPPAVRPCPPQYCYVYGVNP